MYDILQLNDMIVPELLDIAEQLKIPNAKKMDKQELVYKILDNQAIAGAKTGAASGDAKNRQRKRIVKATTGNTTEEAIVESNEKKPVQKKVPAERKKNSLIIRREILILKKRTLNFPKQRRRKTSFPPIMELRKKHPHSRLKFILNDATRRLT